MIPPKGIGQIRRLFGDPRQYIREDGTIAPAWESEILDTVQLPDSIPLSWDRAHRVSRLRCHKLLAPAMTRVFLDIHKAGLWSLLKDFGGCYAWRTQRGSAQKLSTHAWGIAIDLNVVDNPLGSVGDQPVGVLEAFGRQGFLWGGDFSQPDGMHWQMAEGF